MKLSDFASEYDSADLPQISGEPVRNAVLDQHVGGMSAADRTQESIASLLVNAVFLFYFAKRVCPELHSLASAEPYVLSRGFAVITTSLIKQAVIGIASTIDVTGRTRSLYHTLDALEGDLTSRLEHAADDETRAALELLRHIRATSNVDTVVSLKYIRHLRNKWAGHASLDRLFDPWAETDTSVNFALLEDGLVRMVNAFQDLGTLLPMSEALQDIERAGQHKVVHQDGSVTMRMTLAWSGVNALAQAMRHQAQEAAGLFLARVTGATG